ncbi:MAG: intrarane metalloprotease [Symbiobacteriaceae bacterium]|jgi:membrane protease YdiL (CAAX protease family)|nr:intrarane metalloprotease [Symbiobacteriaceae bacterium]
MITAWFEGFRLWTGGGMLLLLAGLYLGAALHALRRPSAELRRILLPGLTALAGAAILLLAASPNSLPDLRITPTVVLIWFGWIGVIWGVTELFRRPRVDQLLPQREASVGSFFGSTVLVTLPAVLYLVWARADVRAWTGWPDLYVSLVTLAAVAAGLTGMVLGLRPVVRLASRGALAGAFAWRLLFEIFTSALPEEILFRVFGQPFLISVLGTVGGMAAVSVLFGLLHLFRLPPQMKLTRGDRLAVVVLVHISQGLLLSLLWQATGSIWIVVGYHALYNAMAQLPRELRSRLMARAAQRAAAPSA